MTPDNLPEEELDVWNIVKVQFAEDHSPFDVIDKQDSAALELGDDVSAPVEAR